jgi:hypothetical protein
MAVAAGKRYLVKFDAWLTCNAATNAPVSFRIHHNVAPWTQYTETKYINLAMNKAHFEVELPVNTTDNSAVLSAWVGHSAGQYHFENISISEL